MNKASFFAVFFAAAYFLAAVSSFAMDLPNRSIFIEGTATLSAHRTFFMDNFRMEASALGYTVAATKEEAGFTFKFDVQDMEDDFNPAIKYIIMIALFYNETNMEMVSFGWPFAELEDMYEHNQFVFYRAAVLIPSLSDDDLSQLVEAASAGVIDDKWQNMFFYIRTSIDYPISFLMVQNTGLVGGATYNPDDLDPNGIGQTLVPQQHKILPQPGITLGIEFQPFKFLSLEANIQVSFGDPYDSFALNLAAGAELRYNHKLNNLMIQPYGTFVYYLNKTPAFVEFPPYAFGGGVQIGVRGTQTGVFFLNINYLMSLTDTYIHNVNPHSSEPVKIHYKRYFLNIGLGYKFGLLSRRK